MTWYKKHSLNQIVSITYTREKKKIQLFLLKVCELLLFRQSKMTSIKLRSARAQRFEMLASHISLT